MINQTLLWTPRSKGRPRSRMVNGRSITYTDHATRAAELSLSNQWLYTPFIDYIAVTLHMSDTEVQVDITPCPEPVSRKLLRGDIDNYAKLILDALNGRAWVDDRQIAKLHIVKD